MTLCGYGAGGDDVLVRVDERRLTVRTFSLAVLSCAAGMMGVMWRSVFVVCAVRHVRSPSA